MCPERALHFTSWHAHTIAGNTFQTGTLYIDHLWLDEHAITDNSFFNSTLRAGESPTRKKANVYIYGNRFDDGSQVFLAGESEGVVEDNMFSNSGISLSTSGAVAVRYNRLVLHQATRLFGSRPPALRRWGRTY
ncbi:MAG: hypothetical protein JXM73_08110 [Anaerolineae bacterium]|nr:hypothetical protein [Anaerolineae bacterium]